MSSAWRRTSQAKSRIGASRAWGPLPPPHQPLAREVVDVRAVDVTAVSGDLIDPDVGQGLEIDAATHTQVGNDLQGIGLQNYRSR